MGDLACEKDYVKMGKGSEGRDVLVWHVSFRRVVCVCLLLMVWSRANTLVH